MCSDFIHLGVKAMPMSVCGSCAGPSFSFTLVKEGACPRAVAREGSGRAAGGARPGKA